jgi:hypothetical protein
MSRLAATMPPPLKEATMQHQLRQGDVLLVAVQPSIRKKLKNARKVAPINDRVVLAYGELTGHAHTIDAGRAQLLEGNDRSLYLTVSESCALEHPEHASIKLEPGLYEVVRQREFRTGFVVASGD